MSNEELDDFKQWFESLPLQTLTQELKYDILNALELVLDEAYVNGVNAAKREMKEFLEGRM